MYSQLHVHNYTYVLYYTMYMYKFLMRDEKKEASKVKQTNKAKQHSAPKADVHVHMSVTSDLLVCVLGIVQTFCHSLLYSKHSRTRVQPWVAGEGDGRGHEIT